MKVIFVGAGPGDPELMTIKARRLVESCSVLIYAGSLVSDEVLNLTPESAQKHDSAKMSLDDIMEVIRDAKDKNLDVVRLHSGDPSIYGAIREQIIELDKLGVEYEVVPGVSSFQASAAALCAELTAPEISQTITLTRAAGRTPVPDEQSLEALGKTRATLCVFLSVDKLGDVARKLEPSYGEQCPVAVVYRASWPDQRIFRGTLADIADTVRSAGVKKTAMIIVGWALDADNATVSRLYAKEFSHEYRKAVD